MSVKYFFDTNLFIYAVDNASMAKRKQALTIIADHARDASISTQVLQEFYAAATRKLRIGSLEAKDYMRSLSHFSVVQVDSNLIFDAIDSQILNKISFWDALIVAAAKIAGCNVILSEDMSHGQIVSGIRIQNPFK